MHESRIQKLFGDNRTADEWATSDGGFRPYPTHPDDYLPDKATLERCLPYGRIRERRTLQPEVGAREEVE